MTDRELSECFSAAQRGDAEAFAALYDEMSGPLFTVILRTLNDRAASEDVLQDLFCTLWKNRETLRVSSPRAYLFSAAHNGAVSLLRRNGKNTDPIDEEIPQCEETSEEEKIDLKDAFADLPSPVRETLALHLNGGLTFREIAKVTGVPIGTALTRYRRGIALLREKCRL